MTTTSTRNPEGLAEFLTFLCEKYNIDPRRVYLTYDPDPPPPLRGSRPGYYDGLLSYRERNGNPEFLITVYRIARNPLLTLGHEFAHLLDDLVRGRVGQSLSPPDDERETRFDTLAMRDLAEFRAQKPSQS